MQKLVLCSKDLMKQIESANGSLVVFLVIPNTNTTNNKPQQGSSLPFLTKSGNSAAAAVAAAKPPCTLDWAHEDKDEIVVGGQVMHGHYMLLQPLYRKNQDTITYTPGQRSMTNLSSLPKISRESMVFADFGKKWASGMGRTIAGVLGSDRLACKALNFPSTVAATVAAADAADPLVDIKSPAYLSRWLKGEFKEFVPRYKAAAFKTSQNC